MRVTKAQAQANRAHIVETASRLFRERGYDGVGVADLMAAAGFTHGGFYKHFGSKADLMAEAAACGLASSLEKAQSTILPGSLTSTCPASTVMRRERVAPWRRCAGTLRVSLKRSRQALPRGSKTCWPALSAQGSPSPEWNHRTCGPR